MSSKKEWREREIEEIARKIAEEVFEEKIKLVRQAVEELKEGIEALLDV